MTHELEDHHHIDKPIAILGIGNMGSALMKGIINAKLTPPKKILACDTNLPRLQAISAEWKIRIAADLSAAVEISEIILLCVKPQTLESVLQTIKPAMRPNHLVISIVAGIRIKFIQQILGVKLGIVRAMPNIAATVDEGAAAIAFGEHVTAEQQRIAKAVFEAVGEVVIVSEDQLDAVT